MISAAKAVKRQIEQMPTGTVFGYDDFGVLAQTKRQALAQALSRLVKKGELKQASRGRFYRPAKNRFGDVPLTDAERLKNALENGYISGTAAFNRLGITTQIPAVIEIASPDKTYSTKIGRLRVQYIRSYVREIPQDVELLMILDAIKDIRSVPDASPDDVVSAVMPRIKKMERARIDNMVNFAKHYPPRVRAVLGAILECTQHKKRSAELKSSLNQFSKYKVGIRKSLPNLEKWKLE